MNVCSENIRNNSQIDFYEEKSDFYQDKRVQAERKLSAISNGRAVSFLLLTGLIVYQLTEESSEYLMLLSVFLLLYFVWLLTRYGRIQRNIDDWNTLKEINIAGIHRIKREWSKLKEPYCPEEYDKIPEAKDLNIVGHASLLKLIGTIESALGSRVLLSWFFDKGPNLEVIKIRQKSIAELAEKIELRQSIQLTSRKVEEKGVEIEKLIKWCDEAPWLLRSPLIKWTVWSLSGCMMASAFAHFTGLVDYPIWLLFVVLNMVFSLIYYSKIDAVFSHVSKREKDLMGYVELFQLIEAEKFDSAGLQRINSTMKMNKSYSSLILKRLKKIIAYSDIRFSPMVYFTVQALTLWSFHVVYFLEQWKSEFSPNVRDWVNASSEFEAICSLASLKFENPDWSFPLIHENNQGLINAKNLGHPLLLDDVRVGNDVIMGNPGTFLFVTGSNMAGKSTFLRSVGVNSMLAQAGSVICAESMSLPLVDVVTSIQVEDSIEDGVSFFMAELQRLKQVVNRAESNSSEDRMTLYLLDEILRGTNSIDRRSAVRIILKKLLRLKTMGAVTTHDLELANCEELAAASEPVHFTEEIDPDENNIMKFDYKMHKGIAKTTNALKLLAAIGLYEEAQS